MALTTEHHVIRVSPEVPCGDRRIQTTRHQMGSGSIKEDFQVLGLSSCGNNLRPSITIEVSCLDILDGELGSGNLGFTPPSPRCIERGE